MPDWLSSLLGALAPWFVNYSPGAPGLRFDFTPSEDAMSLTCTVTFSAPDPKVVVAKRSFTYAIAGAAAVVLDATGGPVSFACNVGDSIDYEAQDFSAGGLASEPTKGTIVAHDNVTVPASPAVSFSFAPAADPAPTPAPAA